MLTVITAPSVEPVLLADAKAHLRIEPDVTDEDALVGVLIAAARQQAEHETGRAFITQTLRLLVPATCHLKLRKPPLVSISSVVLIAEDGTETAVLAADYRLDVTGLLPVLVLKNGTNGARDLRVEYVAGYGAAGTAVPAAIRSWMLMNIGAHFENRESVVVGTIVTQMPTPFIDGLLDPYRIHQGF